MEINIENWKEFEVGNLFKAITKTAKNNNYKKSKGPENEYVIPALSSKATDNSFGFYVRKEDHNLIDELCLSVTSNGDAGKVFVQNKPFAIIQDAYALKVKDYEVGLFEYFFLATILEERLINKYGFNEKATWSKVKKEIIPLPAIYNPEKEDYDPDWNYMEEFIRELKEENERKLFSLRTLFNPDNALIRGGYELDISSWHEFEVEELFNIFALKEKLGVEDMDIVGDTPVYSSETQNYGLYGYTSKKAQYTINDDNPFYIIFGDHTRAFNFIFSDFSISDNVKVLSPKFGNNINTALFIITSWSKAIPDLGYSRHWSIAKNIKILLPAVYNHEKEEYKPDWEYMENFIINLQEDIKNQLRRLRQDE